jgi:hypothetical protein
MTTMIGQPRLGSSFPEYTLALYADDPLGLGGIGSRPAKSSRGRLRDGPEWGQLPPSVCGSDKEGRIQNSTHLITKWELDGGRPITEAAVTRQGGDGSPERGKSEPAPSPRERG